jgi:hypothetical protein
MKYRNLIFLHIPKAAGTTLHSILASRYPAGSHLSIYDPEQAARMIPHWPLARREQIRLLEGHVAFGLHECLVGETTYITLLRDPIERIISHYYYVRRMPGHYLHDRVVGDNMSLAEYAGSGLSDELDNGQVRLIAGVVSAETVPVGACDTRLLEIAKRNIEGHFALAGLTERFDASLALMAIQLGWDRIPTYSNLNVSENKPPKDRIDASARSAIGKANALDCSLYEWAERRFESLLQKNRDRVAPLLKSIRDPAGFASTGT